MSETSGVINGHSFEFDAVVGGDCDGEQPCVIFLRDRLPGDPYPQTEEEYDRLGLTKVEQAIIVSCESYRQLVKMGAPILACAGCPNKPS